MDLKAQKREGESSSLFGEGLSTQPLRLAQMMTCLARLDSTARAVPMD